MRVAIAERAATTTDRTFLTSGLGMPDSFQGPGRGLQRKPYAPRMRVSTISKHHEGGAGTSFARVLGSEVKRRRSQLGLSQATVGMPLSRAFMSSVETGRLVPSLPSLLIIARRLNTSAAAILASVEAQLEDRTGHDNSDEAAIAR